MKSKVNTEGLEVNQEILNAFKNFKQGSILEKSLFRAQHMVPAETHMYLSEKDRDEIIRQEMIKSIAASLWRNFGDSVVVEDKPNPFGMSKVYSMECFMMPLKDFKHALEFTIRTMPMSAIEEIRK